MRKLPLVGLVSGAILFVIDQATKYGITDVLGLNESSLGRDITSFFTLRFVANRGVSLGLLHADTEAMRWGLVVLTAAIAIGVLVWLLRERGRMDALALGAILGGAIGNIADRVRLGYVADFLNLHFGAWSPFFVFNVADAAISIGVVLLAVRALFVRDAAPPSENANV